jgi:hypothetical protein
MQPNFHCPYEDCQAKAVIYTGGDYICTECGRPNCLYSMCKPRKR